MLKNLCLGDIVGFPIATTTAILGLTSFFLMLANSKVLGATVSQQPSEQPFVVDQANTNQILPLFHSIESYEPIGQEFVPTLSSLNVVELYATNFSTPDLDSTLAVNIRQGTITGPILGRSARVRLSDDFVGFTRFDFSSPISLIPNNTYVIEPVRLFGGDAGIASSGGPSSVYPDGSEILQGITQPNDDLLFEEGVTTTVPEPSSVLGLLAFGALGVTSLLKRVKK